MANDTVNNEILKNKELIGSTVVKNSNLIVSDMGDEKVILSVENGKYYNLGLMGSEIWNYIQEPIVVSELIKQLTEGYDVEYATCEEQVLPFLKHLYEEKLIHITI